MTKDHLKLAGIVVALIVGSIICVNILHSY